MHDGNSIHLLTPYVGLSGFFVSLAFLCIEIRNVELVNIGRKCLRRLQFVPSQIDAIYCNDDAKERDEKVKAEYERIKEESLRNNCGWICRKMIVHEFWFRAIYLYVMLMAALSIYYYFQQSISDPKSNLYVFIVVCLVALMYTFCCGCWKREK
jgi:hypothetical protein